MLSKSAKLYSLIVGSEALASHESGEAKASLPKHSNIINRIQVSSDKSKETLTLQRLYSLEWCNTNPFSKNSKYMLNNEIVLR